MMHTTQTLYDQLNNTLLEINVQIRGIKKNTESYIAAHEKPGTTVYDMKNSDGHGVLENMLLAKAQVLAGMATLKASAVKR